VNIIYSGIQTLDTSLDVEVNMMGVLSEYFGLNKYNHTLPELATFAWHIRPYTDLAPYIINYYSEGSDRLGDREYQIVMINLCLMFLSPYSYLYSCKISSILDKDNEITITYNDGKAIDVYIKNFYTPFERSQIGFPFLKPFRTPPSSLFNPKETRIPNHPTFFSISEFDDILNGQLNHYSEFISDIYGLDPNIIIAYAKFIVKTVGNNPYKRYSSKKKLIAEVCDDMGIEKDISEKLVCLSSTKDVDLFDALFLYKPVLISEDSIHLRPYIVPHWVLNLFENIAEKNKSYQIQMGYKFEEEVRHTIISYGLKVLNTKRLTDKTDSSYSNREFDVLVDFDDKILDFQCKNYKFNYNPKPSEIQELKQKHDIIVKRIMKGLSEEEGKKEVLEMEYGKEVEFLAISRFPILQRHPGVISFNDFEEWIKRRTGRKKELL